MRSGTSIPACGGHWSGGRLKTSPLYSVLRILNAFECPYSNGFTEGANNTIKLMKRIGYEYRNFHNLRAHIFAAVNDKTG